MYDYFYATGDPRFFEVQYMYDYFLATDEPRTTDLVESNILHKFQLVAVNEISPKMERVMDRGHELGMQWFIDSGIFALTNSHMRAHNISMDEALALPPEEIDGFDELFSSYIEILTRWKDRAWGYIELDQGGRENKIKTRTRLEKMGFNPIPVYHPLNDGWEYFDYLAERYDRICFGNIVQANRETRLKLITTAYVRKQKYPNLWIHFLGYTPNELLYSVPVESCDSSSWLNVVRWAGYTPRIALRSFGNLPKHYQYVLGDTQLANAEYRKGVIMSAYGAEMNNRNWRYHIERMREEFGKGFE